MRAFQNRQGNVVEIEVDVDPHGNPLLPPDTTVDARPEPLEGHYVTVVGNRWVQIPIPVFVPSFELLKQQALERLATYRNWLLQQPVTAGANNEHIFDADDKARDRLTQALVLHTQFGTLPPAWVKHDNTMFPLTVVADLIFIITTVQQAFTSRFFETVTIRNQLLAATDEAALNAIAIPTIPNRF